MTKNELIEFYDELNASAQKQTGKDFSVLLVSSFVTVRSLYKATRAAKRGDYAEATYYAVLWAGLNIVQTITTEAHNANKPPKKTNTAPRLSDFYRVRDPFNNLNRN